MTSRGIGDGTRAIASRDAKRLTWENSTVDGEDSSLVAAFDRPLAAWRGDPDTVVEDLVTDDDVGHMLHTAEGERTGPTYRLWIANFRAANPGNSFQVLEQHSAGDFLWTRLVATRGDGALERN